MKPLDCLELYEDAEFYDQEFASRDHEIPFFLKHAQAANGPVLEVACGTGRITLPIARAGVDITGLDVSSPMLARARRKTEAEKLSITWLHQDCRNIRADQLYALIFSAANAMQHLPDLASANAFLTSARQALRPNGTLILDVFHPDLAKLTLTATTRSHHKSFTDETGSQIRVEAASEYHPASQILAFQLFYLRDSSLIKTKKVTMRCLFPEELLALCHFNGLDVVNRFGNYNETPFGPDSPKQILLCRKRTEKL